MSRLRYRRMHQLPLGRPDWARLAADYEWYMLLAAPQDDYAELVDISGNERNLAARGAPTGNAGGSFGNGYDALAADVEPADAMFDDFDAPRPALNVVSRIGAFVSHFRTSTGSNHRYYGIRSTGSRFLLYTPGALTTVLFDGSSFVLDWTPAINQPHVLGFTHDPGVDNKIWANGHLAAEFPTASSRTFTFDDVVQAVGGDTFGNSAGRSAGEYHLAAVHVDAGLTDEAIGSIQSEIMLGPGRLNYYWDKVHQHRAKLHAYIPGTDPGGTVALDGSGQQNHGDYSIANLGEPPLDPRFVRSVYLSSSGTLTIPAYNWTGASFTITGISSHRSSFSRAGGGIDPTRSTGGDIAFYPVGGQVSFRWFDGTTTWTANGNGGLSIETPYHWAHRYDHAAQRIATFQNGVLLEDVDISGLTMPDLSAFPLVMNQSFGLSGGFTNHNGLAVFSDALTNAEIAELAA